MSEKRILIVEDEQPIREMITFALGAAGYATIEAADARAAHAAIAERVPDLILLDWMLPGTSGLELARRFKKDELTREVPIIMLTARAEESDKIAGLDAGADDYLAKPFSTHELMARIRAVLRRKAPETLDAVVELGGLRLDPSTRRVTRHGGAAAQELRLGPTEFRLLHFLMTHPERVHSRSQLLDRVWGDHVFIEERTVDVHVKRLREALAPVGKSTLIETVRGAGYRLSAHPGVEVVGGGGRDPARA